MIAQTSPTHPWFKGPALGGVTVSQRSHNGCVDLYTPTNAAGIAAWESLARNPLEVFLPGSRFVGYGLRRAPRGREFCLTRFTIAFPKTHNASDWDPAVPRVAEGAEWAIAVFEQAGIEIEPPAWAPDFGEERRTWKGRLAWLKTIPSANGPAYHPERTLEYLRRDGLPIPDGLEQEAAEWRAAGRIR